MGKSEEALVQEFNAWLMPLSGTYGDYYIGIAADPKDRLLNGHGLDDTGGKDTWRFDTALDSDVALQVVRHFLATGMKGGAGGGDPDLTGVYIYKITPRSKQ